MNLGVVGSRGKKTETQKDGSIKDPEVRLEIWQCLQYFLRAYRVERIISGGADGVDSLAEHFADEACLDKTIYEPDWGTYGSKKAPIIRNQQIVQSSDMVVAFWDGKSRGTRDSIEKAKNANKLKAIIFIEN